VVCGCYTFIVDYVMLAIAQGFAGELEQSVVVADNNHRQPRAGVLVLQILHHHLHASFTEEGGSALDHTGPLSGNAVVLNCGHAEAISSRVARLLHT
jgi:hypothetical protein